MHIPKFLKPSQQPLSQEKFLGFLKKHKTEIPLFGLNVDEFSDLLGTRDGCLRTHFPAHFTTSCVVINPTRTKVLLVLHKKYREWVYPGGHADGDWFWVRSALRECYEETGLQEVSIVPPSASFGSDENLKLNGLSFECLFPHFIQKFEIPDFDDTQRHVHFDAVYVFKSSSESVTCDPAESLAIKWFAIEALQSIASVLTAKVILRALT